MAYNVDESDLAQRLNGVFAMYQGEPFICSSKENRTPQGVRYQLFGYRIGSDSREQVRLNALEPQFSAAAVQFGFCYDNSDRLAYLSPHSSTNRVGSSGISVVWCSHGAENCFNVPDRTNKKLLQCIKGNHMKFSKAVEAILKDKKQAAAFDRHFCLCRERGFGEVVIMHKDKVVGWYNPKDGRCKFRNGPIVKLVKRRLEVLMRT